MIPSIKLELNLRVARVLFKLELNNTKRSVKLCICLTWIMLLILLLFESRIKNGFKVQPMERSDIHFVESLNMLSLKEFFKLSIIFDEFLEEISLCGKPIDNPKMQRSFQCFL